MPLSLNTSQTIVLDSVKIDQFQVTPEGGVVVIHYSIGHTDASGNFVAKKYDSMTWKSVDFEPALYDAVKAKLYSMLDAHLNPPPAPLAPEPEPPVDP